MQSNFSWMYGWYYLVNSNQYEVSHANGKGEDMKEFMSREGAQKYLNENHEYLLWKAEEDFCPLTAKACRTNCVCYIPPYIHQSSYQPGWLFQQSTPHFKPGTYP